MAGKPANETIYGLRRVTWYQISLCAAIFKTLAMLVAGLVPIALLLAGLTYVFIVRPMRALT
jgi:hypothetical protein